MEGPDQNGPGDELTFFYPSTEWEMVHPFQCECGAADCLKWITGASATPTKTLARYELTGVVRQRFRKPARKSRRPQTAPSYAL